MKFFILLLFSSIVLSNFAKGQTWKACLDSANNYKITNQNEKAVAYYYKARNILITDSSNSTTIADLNDSIAAIYLTEQNYKGAEGLYLESRKIRGLLFTQNSLPYAQSCYNLGYIYTQFLDHFDEAIRLFDTTKMILETHAKKESLEYAFALKFSGICYNRMGEDQKALKNDLDAINIIDAVLGEENIESAKILGNIGGIYRNTGNYLTSETYYKNAISLFEKLAGRESFFYLATVNNLANLYFMCFQSYKALPLLLTAKKTIENNFGKNNILYYNNLGLLGQVYREADNFDLAEKYFTEGASHDTAVFGEENEYFAADCFNFGRLYMYMGQYEKSEHYYLQSLQIREKIAAKNTTEYSWSCTDLAQLYIKLRKFEKAESLLLEARRIIEYREGRNNSFIEASKDLGDLYILTKQYKKAEKVLFEAKEVVDVMSYGNSYQNADITSPLGDLNLLLGKYEEAKQYYTTCNRIIEKQGVAESMDHIEILMKLAILDWCQHQTDSTLSTFSRCLSLQKKGLQKIFQFTSQSEKQSYLSKVSDLADYYFSFVLNSSGKRGLGMAYNTSFGNRNIILESFEQLNKAIYNSTDTLERNRYQKWLDTKRELANYYSHSAGQSSNITALEAEANRQEKSLTSFISSIQKDRSLNQITWKQIRDKLLPNEAAIEFLSFRYYDAYRRTDSVYYAALILRKGLPEPELVRLFEQRVLDTILNSHHSNSMASEISNIYTRGVPTQGDISPDKSIYDIVWKPFETKLKGVKRVYFALAGELHKISFAALPIDAHTFLSDQYELIQLDNTASLLDNAEYTVKKTDRVQLFGGVNYDNDSTEPLNRIDDQESLTATRSSGNGFTWGFLPGTQKEITNISTIGKNKNFTINVSLGAAASEESIKSLNGAASPEILHIATHGFFFPDPKEPGVAASDSGQNGNAFRQSQDPLLRSGLILAGANNAWKGNISATADDGILTAYEISNMYLPHTKLVVLSACETALGDIKGSEGVYGLQRAFKMAGVQNLVMSLWKVPDEETSEFMDLFYQYMFSGQPINGAFYLAQSDMKNKYRNTPFKWAAWILIR